MNDLYKQKESIYAKLAKIEEAKNEILALLDTSEATQETIEVEPEYMSVNWCNKYKKGVHYKWIDATGLIRQSVINTWDDDDVDVRRLAINNVAFIDEPEQLAKLVKKARQRQAEEMLLTCIARHNRLNNGWNPDFANADQAKCCFYYDHECNELCWECMSYTQRHHAEFYFPPAAKDIIISELGEELILTALGVE